MKLLGVCRGILFPVMLIAWMSACEGSQSELVSSISPTRVETSETPTVSTTATTELSFEVSPEPSPTSAVRIGNLIDLRADGSLSLQVEGRNIQQIELTIENLLEEAVDVEIPAGTYFESEAAEVQDMVVRRNEIVRLKPNRVVELLLDVACASMEKDVPDEDDSFKPGLAPSSVLPRVMKGIAEAEVDFDVEQAAVWIVTDDANYEDLGQLGRGLAFGRTRAIGPDDAARAMQLVDQAGAHISGRRIWQDLEEITRRTEDSELVLWLVRKASESAEWIDDTISFEKGNIIDFALAPDGHMATSGCVTGDVTDCQQGFVLFRDSISGTTPYATLAVQSVHGRLHFSPDSRFMASITCTWSMCEKADVWIWDVRSGEPVQVLGEHARVRSQVFSPDSDILAVLSCLEENECEIRLWDPVSGELEQTLGRFQAGSMTFTPDSKQLAMSDCAETDENQRCTESQLLLWDVSTGEVAQRLSIDGAEVWSMEFLPDGSTVMMTGRGHPADSGGYWLQSWHVESNQVGFFEVLPTGRRWCDKLALAADATLLAAPICQIDDLFNVVFAGIGLWDPMQGSRLETIEIPPEFTKVLFTPDGRSLATCGTDTGEVMFWKVPGQ